MKRFKIVGAIKDLRFKTEDKVKSFYLSSSFFLLSSLPSYDPLAKSASKART